MTQRIRIVENLLNWMGIKDFDNLLTIETLEKIQPSHIQNSSALCLKMKYSAGKLLGNLALAIVYCSLEADGIRSSTSLSSTSLHSGDRRLERMIVLNTRGGSVVDFSGVSDPRTFLPNSLSGM